MLERRIVVETDGGLAVTQNSDAPWELKEVSWGAWHAFPECTSGPIFTCLFFSHCSDSSLSVSLSSTFFVF